MKAYVKKTVRALSFVLALIMCIISLSFAVSADEGVSDDLSVSGGIYEVRPQKVVKKAEFGDNVLIAVLREEYCDPDVEVTPEMFPELDVFGAIEVKKCIVQYPTKNFTNAVCILLPENSKYWSWEACSLLMNRDDVLYADPSYCFYFEWNDPSEYPIVYNDFEDNKVMVRLKKEYSDPNVEVTPEAFPELDVIEVNNYAIADKDENFVRDICIILAEHDKDKVMEACELLKTREDIVFVYPSYMIHIDFWDPVENTMIYGDLDGNGIINMKDVLFLRKAVAQIVYMTPFQNKAADMNGDNKINMKDLLLLRKASAGLLIH